MFYQFSGLPSDQYKKANFNQILFMAKLPKYTLKHNKKTEEWDLVQDKTKKLVETFETKQEATKGGVLKKSIGGEGGSVKIKKEDGKFQEERTFPKNKDPKSSEG